MSSGAPFSSSIPSSPPLRALDLRRSAPPSSSSSSSVRRMLSGILLGCSTISKSSRSCGATSSKWGPVRRPRPVRSLRRFEVRCWPGPLRGLRSSFGLGSWICAFITFLESSVSALILRRRRFTLRFFGGNWSADSSEAPLAADGSKSMEMLFALASASASAPASFALSVLMSRDCISSSGMSISSSGMGMGSSRFPACMLLRSPSSSSGMTGARSRSSSTGMRSMDWRERSVSGRSSERRRAAPSSLSPLWEPSRANSMSERRRLFMSRADSGVDARLLEKLGPSRLSMSSDSSSVMSCFRAVVIFALVSHASTCGSASSEKAAAESKDCSKMPNSATLSCVAVADAWPEGRSITPGRNAILIFESASLQSVMR
mmetsp:Transcript_20024/g.60653  ORF Transcript_20024/g.60653 Transcript_20024/m.60653 type:complete len:375 (+) Transcript_20024:2300-3424(+)